MIRTAARQLLCPGVTSAVVIGLATLIAWHSGWSQQTAARPLVLRGATLIDGTGGAPVPDAVIVIEGDKVKAMGGRGTAVPSGATVLDLSGKFVIPGLVDGHVHYAPWLGELLLNYGVTTVLAIQPREPYGESYYQDSQKPGFRAPRLFDYGGVLRLSPEMTQAQVREMIQAWLKRKPEFAKVPTYNDRVRQPYQWMIQEIHDAGLVTFGHAEDCRAAAEAGLDIIEHLWGCAFSLMNPEERDRYQKGEYLHWGLFLKDQARGDQLIRELLQRGARYINPTLLYEFGSQARLASRFEADTDAVYKSVALMSYFPAHLAEGLRMKFRFARNYSAKYGFQVAVASLTPQERQQASDAYRLSGDFSKRWVALGGKVMGGSDAPSIGTAGLALHLEMAMLVESGLTPLQALQSAGIWSVEMMTARRKSPVKPMVGLLAEGTYADLVVLSASPLQDIANTRKIERVMKGGEFVELGYSPDYATPPPGLVRATPHILEPEISSLTPSRVTEGSPGFEMTVDGEGFMPHSVVRLDGAAVPTTFVNTRTLKARIPPGMAAQAVPNRFVLSTNPEQRNGVYGDRTIKVTVFTAPPDGGSSNSVSLKVIAKWLADEK